MSSDLNFPLHNMRKSVDGTWEQVHITTESITVPGSASNYAVRLKEIPDNGTVNTAPSITGLTLITTYPPTAGTFYVNYTTGDLVFPSALEGNTYSIDYWQRGSLISADDINYLNDEVKKAIPYSIALGGTI